MKNTKSRKPAKTPLTSESVLQWPTPNDAFLPAHMATLRDYFAAAALTGLVTLQAHDPFRKSRTTFAAYAYAHADRMLAARKQPATTKP
jgi:hypothetical protein